MTGCILQNIEIFKKKILRKNFEIKLDLIYFKCDLS